MDFVDHANCAPAPAPPPIETPAVSFPPPSGGPPAPPPRRKRRKRTLPKSFPAAEVEALLGAADAPRDRLLLGLGLFCGLRVSELCKLEAPDLDLGAGQLLVREGKGGKDRTVPLPSRLVEELRGWLGGRTVGLVFPSPRKAGRPLTTRAVQLLIKRVAAKANIPGALEARKVHPHRLRHSFATRLLRSGADIIEVRDLLGHSSVGTTQVYLSADTTRLRSAVERAAGGG